MNKLFLTCLVPLSLFSMTEIIDTAGLPFLNPDLEQRQTAKLELDNGLSVLLISDPKADLSAATMSVGCGSWQDPMEYPGMAHFCEHMLFMGSEKYPDENGFSSRVATYGGVSNAFTADEKTVYMFSAMKEGFLEVLDRFAHFFIDPLFDMSSVSRELHAVDQEFAKNIQNDMWRIYMIWKETGNPEHPNQMFSLGNSKTLSDIPQSALKDWHAKHYTAPKMHLAVYSSLDLKTLKSKVKEFFGLIPNSQEEEKQTPFQTLLSEKEKGHITYITPFQHLTAALLRWELPLSLANDPSHPAQTLAFALARAQEQNLEELLKKQKRVDQVSIGTQVRGPHRFFNITLYLTQKGMKELKETIQVCFQALQNLKEGVPLHLFEERNTLAKLHYQYQNRVDPFSYIQSIGEVLSDEPLSSFPRGQIIGSKYSPDKINEVLSLLVPEECAITVVGPLDQTGVIPETKEKWFGAEYAIRPFSLEMQSAWKDVSSHEEIAIAKPNSFIPSNLNVVKEESSCTAPVKIAENEFGIAYYARCPEFLSPEISYTVHIYTPAIHADPKSQVLAALYLDHLTDQINPLLEAAGSSGMNTRMSLDRLHFQIQVTGFSDKADLFLKQILEHLHEHPPTAEDFAHYFERHEKGLSNASKELAFRQAKERLDSVLFLSKPTSQVRLEILKTITFEEFAHFCAHVFDQVYLQAVFSGNLTSTRAVSSWMNVLHILGKNPYPKALHPKLQALQLHPNKGPYRISETVPVAGNAALLLMDEGAFTFAKRGVQEILSIAVKEAFFQELRTKQKTGYIVSSDAFEVENHLYQIFCVQSNSHLSEDLLYRFELFLETYLHNLEEEIPEARFEMLKASSIESLKTRFRNLKLKSLLWDQLAFQHDADFSFVEKRISALEELTYSEFTEQVNAFLSRENKKRLAFLLDGTSPSFSYQTITSQQVDAFREDLEESGMVVEKG